MATSLLLATGCSNEKIAGNNTSAIADVQYEPDAGPEIAKEIAQCAEIGAKLVGTQNYAGKMVRACLSNDFSSVQALTNFCKDNGFIGAQVMYSLSAKVQPGRWMCSM